MSLFAVGFANFVNMRDVGMAQSGCRFGFLDKAPHPVRIGGEGGG